MRSVFLFLLPFLVHAQTYDLLIQNGRIFDGVGNPWFYGDVAVRGDTIAAIGHVPQAQARLHIDAKGLAVAPGFIDIHSHGRRGIFEVPSPANYLHEGVTTIIEGPDGSSPIPLGPFLKKVAGTPISINFASFVGHGSLRSTVMGLVNRKSTPEELEKMKALARQAMLDGAVGLSTGLFYVPGTTPIPKKSSRLQRWSVPWGAFTNHTCEMKRIHIEDSVRETIRIGEEGHLPTQITHHKVIGSANWGKSTETLKLIEEARARGVDVTIDQYPYTASSTGISALFPHWSLEGGTKR